MTARAWALLAGALLPLAVAVVLWWAGPLWEREDADREPDGFV